MERGNDQQRDLGCRQPTGHGDHLCRLMERGQTGEIRRAAEGAAWRCGNCQAQAADPGRLCNPLPLEA